MINLNADSSNSTDTTSFRWTHLTSELRGTALFGKVHWAAESEVNSNVISTNYQLLLFALGSSHNEQDLQFAATKLVAAMGEALTLEDKDELNLLLAKYEFGFTV
jgi:hypothetical protein